MHAAATSFTSIRHAENVSSAITLIIAADKTDCYWLSTRSKCLALRALAHVLQNKTQYNKTAIKQLIVNIVLYCGM